MKDMQCARGCHAQVYSNREVVFTMREHEQGMEIPAEYLPRCPICGGTMQDVYKRQILDIFCCLQRCR